MDRDLSMTQLKSIPCNIITCFLGLGKTTPILKASLRYYLANIKPWINTLAVNRVKAVLGSNAGFIGLNISSDSSGSENTDSGSLESKTINITQNQDESPLELIFGGQHITDHMLKNWTTFLTR
jgi:hypothetical protein